MKLRNNKILNTKHQILKSNFHGKPIKVKYLKEKSINQNKLFQEKIEDCKYQIYKIPKDGSCYFHCISLKINKSMKTIKKEIIQWNISNWDTLIDEHGFDNITVGQLVKMTHFEEELFNENEEYFKTLYYQLFLENTNNNCLLDYIPWAGCSEQYATSQLYKIHVHIFEGKCIHSKNRIRTSKIISKTGCNFMTLERNAILKEIQSFGKNYISNDVNLLFHKPSLHYMLLKNII